jgi:hypothetical protein
VEAAELIVEVLENASAEPRHLMLPVDLVARDSTRSIMRRRGREAVA